MMKKRITDECLLENAVYCLVNDELQTDWELWDRLTDTMEYDYDTLHKTGERWMVYRKLPCVRIRSANGQFYKYCINHWI